MERQVILITGGSQGMGASHARTLVSRGHNVLLGDVKDAEGEQLAHELGPQAAYVSHDVTQPESWDRFVQTAVEQFGAVDGLVNNAGILVEHGLMSTSLGAWHNSINVNQTGTFLGMQAVVPLMRKRGRGSIVNISSIAGLVGFADTFAYVATKWAVRGMTKAAALDLAKDHIRVNSIHPGETRTPMIEGHAGDNASVLDPATIPLGRFADPHEVSELVALLLSPESSYITGSEFIIDGGATAGAM